jgi:chromosome segregation protein
LLQAAASGKLAGLVGRLSQQVQAPADVRRAILAALGEFRDGLAFRSIEDIGEALRMMNGDAWEGRAGLLPLTSPRPPHLLRAPQNAGCLGNAAELANVSERFRSAADLLLGRTLVVRDHEAARRLLASLPADGRVVTLAGELFYPGGQVLVSGGNPAQGASEALREAEAGAALLRDELSTAEAEAKRANAQTDSARNRAEGAAAAARQAEAAAQEAELRLKQAELTDRSAAAQEASQREAVQRLQGRVAEVAAERARLGERAASFDREQAELDAMIRALTARLTSLERPAAVAEAQSRLELARRAALEARGHLSDLQERLAAARGECESRRARLQTYLAGQDEARQAIQAAGQEQAHVEEAVVALEAEMGAGEESLAASEQKRAGLEAREARVRTELQEAEHRHSQAQIDLARRQQELDSLKQRIEDDFGLVDFEFEAGITGQGPLPIEGLVERLPHVDSLPLELESQVTRLRLQLRRMGAVNVEAQTEYTEVRERVDFLTSQVDDLRKAESQIQEVIAELDHLMEREFRKTFEAVATTFRQTFSRLFGGGSARLVLTDADDLTNTGIDIEARLPGRREHGLAMLSGGERSLTACALVFSLLKVSPTPFCVLDEVDAMLDEANVARFGEMLRELANDTQFIMITHNRQTIQTAEVVYGISMGPDSASRMISLKLDQVEKEVLGKG